MTPAPPTRPRTFWLQMVSLLATGWIIWNRSLVPQLNHHSLSELMLRAVWFALLAGLWSAFITLGLMLAIRRVERAHVIGVTLRTAAAGIWFAPATILLLQGSPLAVGAAAILVANATRLLYSQWRLIHPPPGMDTVLVPQSAGIFGIGEVPDAFLPRNFIPALAVAVGLQAGIVAWLFGASSLASAAFTMTTALLTIFSISAGAWEEQRQPSLPRSLMGILLTVLLAAALTMGGYATASNGTGGNDDQDQNPFHNPARPQNTTRVADVPHPPPVRLVQPAVSSSDPASRIDPASLGPSAAGAFPGVIIWPEVKPITMLIEPIPVNPKLAGRAPSHPLIIPFGGEYWLFRFPFSRPPASSILRKGSPALLSFTSVDRWPLLMEAHQKLSQPLDLTCCSHIQILVSNADLFPHTVMMELQVIDNKAFGLPAQSLGQAPVQSAPDINAHPVTPVSETLDFTVPTALTHSQFDELVVIFHRAKLRGDRSARIAIEHFALIPRGQ